MREIPLTARPHTFYVRPAPGWVEELHKELTELAQAPFQKYKFEPKITLLKGAVKVHRCDWRQGLELMMRATTAHDFEWLILESKCRSWGDAEAIFERVPWHEFMPKAKTPAHISVDCGEGFTINASKLRDIFRRAGHISQVSEEGKLRFKIELRGELLKLYVSLAGDRLYKRGYKAKLFATAPLPEHQAAACGRWTMELADKEQISSVFVPFAGSGTLGFESLIALSGSGTGAFRQEFACELFPANPSATMGYLRKKLSEKLTSAKLPKVIFNEINSEAATALKENTKSFKSEFEVVEGDFFEMEPKLPEGKTLVLLNPPYGDRLAKDSSNVSLYERLGKKVQQLAKSHPNQILVSCLCPDEETWRGFLKYASAKTASGGIVRRGTPETRHFTHGGKDMRIVRWSA